MWVTIHEITHAVQFSGAPWLREHLGGMITELIEGLQVSMGAAAGRRRGLRMPKLPRMPDLNELRAMAARAGGGQLLRLTLGEDRWLLVERMQAAMSLIEGHAEHVMDEVGEEVLPSLPRLREAMNRRRSQKGLPWKVLERLLGLEMKMRQYETGRRFCDEVVREGGPETLALAWRGPGLSAERRRARAAGPLAGPDRQPRSRRQPPESAPRAGASSRTSRPREPRHTLRRPVPSVAARTHVPACYKLTV